MTELYRYFDESGNLLYVGISLSTVQRAIQHRADADWWQLAVRIEIKRYRTRKLALAAERRAIKRERPKFNSAHVMTDRERLKSISVAKAAQRLRRWGVEILLDEAYYEIPAVAAICSITEHEVEEAVAAGHIIHKVVDFRPARGDVVLVSGRALYLYLCDRKKLVP